MTHVLPPLPYGYAALEPTIEAYSMMLHHTGHHAAYVKALNEALGNEPALQQQTALWLLLNPGKIPKPVRARVLNNAGGHVNHCLFWRAMAPRSGGVPDGALADAIDRDFGSFEHFKNEFTDAGNKQFGSGWVWLVSADRHGSKLEIVTTAGHQSPFTQGQFPILLNDVWEHAYYLEHENRRAEYLKSWWAVVNWKEASHRFEYVDKATKDVREVERESVPVAAGSRPGLTMAEGPAIDYPQLTS